MLIFIKDGFISIVQHSSLPNSLIIRSAKRRYLARFFPKKEKSIQIDDTSDYRYFLVVSRKETAKVISDYILSSVNYNNYMATQNMTGIDWDRWVTFLSKVCSASRDL